MSGSIGQSSPGGPGIKVVNFHDMHSENSFVCRCLLFVFVGRLSLLVVCCCLSLFPMCRCLSFVFVGRLSLFVVVVCCCLSFVVVGCCLSFVVLCQESVVQVIRGVQGVQVAQVV